MNDLVNLISNTNPVIASVLILLGVTVAMLRKGTESRLKALEKRLDEYDGLHIEATMAKIMTDLEYIKTTLLKLAERQK